MTHDISNDETVIVPDPDDPIIGKTIGNYHVLSLLGRGGFGSVYKAKDTKLGRDVALKFLIQAHEGLHTELFEREARALGALGKHGNIVQIHAWDEYEGKNFFVLEFMPTSASDLLRKYSKGMPIKLATRIIAECADALTFAHDADILHRDIKAQNILLEGENGTAKIADFGLARICGVSSNTIEGSAIGSPAYMAPEQARGKELTHLCDIYSLGATLYELLCAKHAVSGTSVLDVLEKVRNNERTPLRDQKPGLPEAIYAIVDKATASEPADRYQSAAEFAEAVRNFDSVKVNPVKPPKKSSDKFANAMIAALVVLLIGGGGYLYMSMGAPTPTDPVIDSPEEVSLPPLVAEDPIPGEVNYQLEDVVADVEPLEPEPEKVVIATPPVVEAPEPTPAEAAKDAAIEESERIAREKADAMLDKAEEVVINKISEWISGDSGNSSSSKPSGGKGKGNSKKKK
jgi:serine/threonine protein kinase